ncbi:MAG: hypothetical protein C0483_25750 [Pirellula sp.]|nr:hypothetical protein [Pirellula sp.]
MSLRLLSVMSLTALVAVVGCYQPAQSTVAGPGSAGGSGSSASLAMLPKASPSPSPSAAPATSATVGAPKASSSAGASPTGTKRGDGTFRDALQRPMPTAPAATQSSRSPVRKTAAGSVPPPRTRVLEAPTASAGVLPITFDSLMFPMERNDPFSPTLLTDAVRALFNKRVKIRGFIHPSCPFETGVKSFILVRDDQGCCFGPGALLYDCIIVDMVPGKTTKFSTRPVAVEGTLEFREYKDLNGKHEAIFHLEADAVE